MRHGPLKVLEPVVASPGGEARATTPFMLQVTDDDGPFTIIGSRWVRERWAGAAPVEPATAEQFRTVEALMLKEAEKRRHNGGDFGLHRPMILDDLG